jgi:regulator of cell morphogenesis and NO signaling
MDSTRWDTAPLSDLIHFIIAHYHDRLRAALPELVALAREVEQGSAGHVSCPRGLAAHLEAVLGAIEDHLLKEERILFPMILEGYGARVSGPVRVLETEHDEHCANLARIRALTTDLTPPAEANDAWRRLYQRLGELETELFDHIHLENDVLFPRALNE